MITLYPNTENEPSKPAHHLMNLKKAKELLSIPLIASLNAVNDESWVQFARDIEQTGVDALELNFYTIPEKSGGRFDETEKNQIKILKNVKSAVKIPVSVKLSPFYSNPLKFISELEQAGADAFVLFNRLFQPDIDVEEEKLRFPFNLSNAEDSRLPLRFAGLLFGNTKSSVCTSSGIFTGNDVIKMILAGADCVQVVSTLYKNRIEVIRSILDDIEKWMKNKGYHSIESFRGKLSGERSENRLPYHRSQYIDFKLSTSAIMKKYKTIR
jgi:dihydroorotate dehydrogenase (fumarate)